METAKNGSEGLVTTYEFVDPDLAKTWLDAHNTHNRPISKVHVATLAADLTAGRWKTTHQGVAFDTNGVLVDGQHRLAAIVEAGIGATLQITRGVDPQAFEVIDQHKKRTAGQILAMEGIQRDAPRLAAMARALLFARHNKSRITIAEATQFALEKREHFEKFLPIARKFSPAAGAAFALASMWGWEAAEKVADRMINLTFEGETDPAKVLFKAAEVQFPKFGAGDTGLRERFAVTINCLHAAQEGRAMKVARKSAPDFEKLERLSASATPEEEAEEAPASVPPPVPEEAKKAGGTRPFDLAIRGAVPPRVGVTVGDRRRQEAEAFAERVRRAAAEEEAAARKGKFDEARELLPAFMRVD